MSMSTVQTSSLDADWQTEVSRQFADRQIDVLVLAEL